MPAKKKKNQAVMKNEKQKKLNHDYADFLAEHEAVKAQGQALGTFLEWLHKNDRNGVNIDGAKKR